jgi:hypothetical protein
MHSDSVYQKKAKSCDIFSVCQNKNNVNASLCFQLINNFHAQSTDDI